MKLGTWIRLPDGRAGTVVYNSLVGVGIKWGLHDPDPADFEGTTGDTLRDRVKYDFQWKPDALLRDYAPALDGLGFDKEDFVGEEYEIIRDGLSGGGGAS